MSTEPVVGTVTWARGDRTRTVPYNASGAEMLAAWQYVLGTDPPPPRKDPTMGQSPSADLYFGYDLGQPEYDDDTDTSTGPEWLGEEDWEDELARRLGWVEAPFPDDYPQGRSHAYRFGTDEYKAAFDEDQQQVTEYKTTSPKYLAYAASRIEKDRLLATVPVELDTYGYLDGGDDTYAIRVKASVQRANDWGSIPLAPLVEQPEWRDHLAQFIELLGFDLGDKQPGWHLNCSYG